MMLYSALVTVWRSHGIPIGASRPSIRSIGAALAEMCRSEAPASTTSCSAAMSAGSAPGGLTTGGGPYTGSPDGGGAPGGPAWGAVTGIS